MKLVFFSDTHTYHRRCDLPAGDVLIHCGDLTAEGEEDTVLDFVEWMSEGLKHRYKHKLFVPGNHDYCFDIRSTKFVQGLHAKLEDSGIAVCIDRRLELGGVVFYGSPWVPNLPGWAFFDRGRDRFTDVPKDTEVLITHTPPKGILDTGDFHDGSIPLLRCVRGLPRLKVHAFGHVHEGYGQLRQEESGPLFINACICTRAYQPTNDPIVVDLEQGEAA
jgi:Icc-related predicted phosphoesterase